MATGQTRINRALRLIGALGSGQSPTANETADALTAYNALIESWQNNSLFAYATVDSTLSLVNGQQSYTIGSGGDLNITRPVAIEDAFVTNSGVDVHVRLVDQLAWDSIPNKSVTSPIAEYAFYNPTMAGSLGTLKVYPIPSVSASLHVITRIILTTLSAAGDAVLLPPGFDRLIDSHLAIELAPEYGKEPSAALIKMAKDSMAEVKRANIRPITAGSDVAALINSNRGTSRILTGP